VLRLDPADVVVVGAGAAGTIIAHSLARAGLKVVCLEQGGFVAPDGHPHGRASWEWERTSNWSTEANVRRGPGDYPIDTSDEHTLMWNGAGGSTVVYTAIWPRLRPADFRKGTEHGCAPDWPLTYEDLEPFYDRTDALLGVSGLTGDPAIPRRAAFSTAPLALGDFGRVIARGFDRLGWHWWPIPCAIISEDYDGRLGCNNCGNCQSGCSRGSLADMSQVLWPQAIKAGATLHLNARVERIETDQSGRATGAVYVDRYSGKRRFQAADMVVVACNGIGTPRLLLLSESARHPHGLANSSDQVGRHLMHHTLVVSEMWVNEPIASHIGATGALICEEFAETDVGRGFINGFNLNVLRTNGAGDQMLGSFSGNIAPWGATHHDWFERHFDHVFCAGAIGDDLPQASNRVTLSQTLTDDSGLPAPRIVYKPHENDWRMMRWAADRLKELAGAVNAFDFKLNDFMEGDIYRPPAWHLLGTARMGNDPGTSVTNRWHQSWDAPNLYVVDGSSFPTGGPVNPTSTICAMALRAAEHLRENFRNLRGAVRTPKSNEEQG
jgi:2-methyl-1,2-propanediol dehydrogenase